MTGGWMDKWLVGKRGVTGKFHLFKFIPSMMEFYHIFRAGYRWWGGRQIPTILPTQQNVDILIRRNMFSKLFFMGLFTKYVPNRPELDSPCTQLPFSWRKVVCLRCWFGLHWNDIMILILRGKNSIIFN